jgi:hypothetical protein
MCSVMDKIGGLSLTGAVSITISQLPKTDL